MPSAAIDEEFAAMQSVHAALEPLKPEARVRVVTYIASRLEILLDSRDAKQKTDDREREEEVVKVTKEQTEGMKFQTFAELFDATNPSSTADKALVAGYWLQVCQAAESFDGRSANNELKHLGHGLSNITNAIDSLKTQKPALALQLKKSGTSQQARKTYKITGAGIKAVENLIHG